MLKLFSGLLLLLAVVYILGSLRPKSPEDALVISESRSVDADALDEARAKVYDLESTAAVEREEKRELEESRSKIRSLELALSQAEHNALDIHDAEVDSLRKENEELKKTSSPVKPRFASAQIYKDPWTAEEAARSTHHSVMLLWSISTCQPCKIIENKCLPDDGVQRYFLAHYEVAHIDANENPRAAALFGIPPGATFPIAMTYDPDTRKISRYVPSTDPVTFLQQLKDYNP